MEQHKIVVLDDWTNFWGTQPSVERLRQRGELTIYTTPAADEGEVVQRLANATVALAEKSVASKMRLNPSMPTSPPSAPVRLSLTKFQQI